MNLKETGFKDEDVSWIHLP